MSKLQADWINHRTESIFHRWYTSGVQGRKLWRPKIRDEVNEAKLKVLVKDLEALDRRLILRAKNTGSWMTVQHTTVTGTVLVAT